MSKPPNSLVSPVYMTISSRLMAFNPPINIAQHVKSGLSVGRSTLEGISFVAANPDALMHALRNAKDGRGNDAFAEGSADDPRNWALQLSYKQTHGVGFREIWYPVLSERPLSLADAMPNRFRSRRENRFNARFNDSLDNHTSLHCAVAPDICNIHIDEMGFIITGPDGDIVIDPDFAEHLVNELLFKSKLDHKLPDWLIDRLSIELPNSTNDYSRVGLSVDLAQQKNYRLRVTGSCSVLGRVDCSATVSFSGVFGN
jgi:hypothetical protein